MKEKIKNISIEDVRISITKLCSWLNYYSDCSPFKDVTIYRSDDYLNLRYELEIHIRNTRDLVNKTSEGIELMEGCIRELTLAIQRQQAIRSKGKKSKKLE
jgi:hypothetical protein